MSEALEITMHRCLEPPFPTRSDLHSYADLLNAARPEFAKHETLDAFLSSIVQLGKLLPSSSRSKGKHSTKERAQHVVAAVVQMLKQKEPGDSASSVTSFKSDLPERAAAQAQELEDLGKDMNNKLKSR